MATYSIEQLGELTCQKIKSRGLLPSTVERDEGYSIVRVKDPQGRVISSVTFADRCADMEVEIVEKYIDALVLERCRAALKEPVLRVSNG